jgi:hypothetical protein
MQFVEAYGRLRREPESAGARAFVQAALSAETEEALAVLYETMALDQIVAGQDLDEGSLDIEAITAYGWGQFLRAEVLQEGEAGALRGQAMSVLFLAYQHDPALVPEQTLPTFTAASPERALVLGSRKLVEYRDSGDAGTLFLAVGLLEGATAGLDPEGPDADEWFDQLVAGYSAVSQHHLMLFLRTGNAEQLDEAVEVARAAVDRSPAAAWPALADQLSDCLRVKAEAYGDAEAVEEAIVLSRTAVVMSATDGHPNARYLSRLAVALRIAYGLSPTPERIDEAVHFGRQALEHTPDDDPNRPARAGNHAASLVLRFRLTARTDDLTEAVEWYKRAAARQVPGDPDPGMAHANLCEVLRLRFLPTTDVAGMRQAVDAGRRAVALTPPEHASYALYCGNVAAALLSLMALTDDHSVVDEAVRMARAAVAATAPGHADHLARLGTLIAALQEHYGRTGDAGSLDECLALSRRGIEAATPSHPDFPGILTAHAAVLREHYYRTGKRAYVEESVNALREASEAVTPHRFGKARILRALVGSWQEAVSANVASHDDIARLLPGMRDLVRDAEPGSAMDAYTLAVEQLPFAVGPRLTREAQEAMLPDTTGVAIAAAACALELADPLRAVRLLEAGRATLLTQVLDLRGPLSAVHDHAPHLAARWQQLRQESSVDREETLVQRHGRAARWDGLRRELDALPGVADMVAPLSRATLADVAAEGPVVIVNAHGSRTDAVVIKGGEVEAVRLPLSEEEAARAVGDLLRIQPESGTRPGAARQMSGILEWLWDVVAQPVLRAAGMESACAPDRAPRLWWCPTGLFTFLPLAAAGHHGSTDTVLDHVTSSFTPTIRALTHARRPRPDRIESFLGVAVPDATGLPHLAGVSAETGFLRDRFPDGVFLAGTDATAQGVLARLAGACRAHFACHGLSSPYSPSAGCLILHDGSELRVTEVGRLDLDADLAFLSACSTAQGGYELPDEAITIASAFLLAGYRNVVGTLWPIYDSEAPRATEDFYRALTPATVPARALHRAVHRARARIPDRPDVWSSYVHYGS